MVAAAEDPKSASLLQMITAVEVLLEGIGEDGKREGLLKTPLRVASAFHEAVSGYQLSAKEIVGAALFSEAGAGGGSGCGGGSGGSVIVRDIDLFALCESCLLPFRLRCHVVYIPSGERVVGLSKLPRVAEIYAKRLQNPQKFANEVVQALDEAFSSLGVGVMVESWHMQWPAAFERNVVWDGHERLGFGWVPVSVYAGKGQFEDLQSSLWDEFLTILELDRGRPILGTRDEQPGKRKSCPFLLYDGQGVSSFGKYGSPSPEGRHNRPSGVTSLPRSGCMTLSLVCASAAKMAVGIESLLRALGGEPSKEELRSSAFRFVNWMLCATQGSRESLSDEDHDLHGTANGTACQSNGNGFLCCRNGALSHGNGSASADGLNGTSISGFTIRARSCSSSLSNGSSTWRNGGSSLSNGALSYGGNAPSGQGVSDGVTGLHLYGNGTVSDSIFTLNNGNGVVKVGSISGVENHTEGLVCVELDMSFSSLCEHHLLPFFGVVHLGFIRGKCGLHIDRSSVMKIIRIYSRRLQVQERLTRQIAEAVVSSAGLQGAMVLAEASHTCIMSRGVGKLSSSTATVATIGKFSSDGAMRAAFLKRILREGGTISRK